MERVIRREVGCVADRVHLVVRVPRVDLCSTRQQEDACGHHVLHLGQRGRRRVDVRLPVLVRVDAVFQLQILDAGRQALGHHAGTRASQYLAAQRRDVVAGDVCEAADVIDARPELVVGARRRDRDRRRARERRPEQEPDRAVRAQVDATRPQDPCACARDALDRYDIGAIENLAGDEAVVRGHGHRTRRIVDRRYGERIAGAGIDGAVHPVDFACRPAIGTDRQRRVGRDIVRHV